MSEEISEFRGTRKITSLGTYPLKYHKNEAELREELIERGKKFVSLGGVNYKSHAGMAYYKKKKSVLRMNINGRIMVDASTHRRVNANYPISLVRPKDHDVISDEEGSDDELDCYECDSDGEGGGGVPARAALDKPARVKMVTKVFKDKRGTVRSMRIPRSFLETEEPQEKLDKVATQGEKDEVKHTNGIDGETDKDSEEDDKEASVDSTPVFSDEEYLIASPVVLGFSFNEKLWLEFTVSGIKEIVWNEQAYDSLVLGAKTKEIVKVSGIVYNLSAACSTPDQQRYRWPKEMLILNRIRHDRLSWSPTNIMLLRA